MHVEYTPAERALRDEIQAYLRELISEALLDELAASEGGGPLYHRALQKMGRDGWLGIGWPVEHGGQGRGPIEQFIFFDEVQGAGFPVPILTLNTVGPTLMRFGTEAQKAALLPRILAGRCHFSIGYSEPSAGTDLASLKTKAVRDGDDYVINGQKVWTSLADHADYFWLAVRTDPDAASHRGISILIVPASAPGISTTRIRALGDNNLHAVFFQDVRVPESARVGDENAGWTLITSQLNYERVALNAVAPLHNLLVATRELAAGEAVGSGRVLLDEPWVQTNLARVDAKLEVLRLLNWQQACAIREGKLTPADASTIKVYGSELYVEASRLLMEIHGAAAVIRRGSPAAVLYGRLEKFYRASLVLTFGGGANEIQRDIIAMTGLAMPKVVR